MRRTRRVVVAGAGFAGLEAAFYLRKRLGDGAEIRVVSDSEHFLYRPGTVYIPFGRDPASYRFGVRQPLHRQNIAFVDSPLEEVDPARHVIRAGPHRFDYDYLIIATGAALRTVEIPGLAEFARSIATPEAMVELRGAFQNLVWPRRRQRVLFLVPPHNRCAGPLYEVALMLDTWLRWRGARSPVELVLATHEFGYLQPFGPYMDATLSHEFSRRGIEAHKRLSAVGVEPGCVLFDNGERLTYDLLITFPPCVAAAAFPSLQSDERGFLRTEMDTRRVCGHDAIFAAGDTSAFPVKQALLAWLQADAAAEQVASAMLGVAPRFHFEPVSLCVLEQFDRAAYARAPLRFTGRPDGSVLVDVDHPDYRVETSRAWRLGKKAIGMYVPWRLRAGAPFYAGWGGKSLDAGFALLRRAIARHDAAVRVR